MLRMVLSMVFAIGFVGGAIPADEPKVKMNQMVKGTVKSVDVSSGVLIVAQTVKNEKVDRQLSITPTVEWEIKDGTETKSVTGKDGLALLSGKEGATVQVKCDKDVNVLKVTVTIKK